MAIASMFREGGAVVFLAHAVTAARGAQAPIRALRPLQRFFTNSR